MLMCLICLTIKAEQLEINLIDFATFVSESNKINILVDENLRNENIVFIINDKEDFLLEAFEKAVNLKDLELVFTDKFYYVRKKNTYIEDYKYRSIKLNFVKYEDIQNFLKVYTDIKYEFISTSKTLLIASKEKEFNSINEMIKLIDTLPKQLKLKITILDTNLDKLKELGTDTTEIKLENTSNFFFNLVSYPFAVTNQIPTTQKKSFYTFLKFLNQNGVSEFISSPILTLADEKEVQFRVVNKIPVLTGSSSLQSATYTTSNAYEYKDVGLLIKATPHIYADNNVHLDLSLEVSNIVSKTNNLVETSEKSITQQFTLSTNQLFVLTGINKKEFKTEQKGIPLFSDIPFLGWIFKYETTDENKNNLSIVFELISEDDYTNKHFAVIVPNEEF